MNSNVQELVAYIARSLVRDPDAVKVVVTENDASVLAELSVAPEDMGRVIGKQGRTAKAIRTVVKSATSLDGRRYSVEIL